MNIRIAGFGGQGVVMAGYVLGHAGTLDGRNALQTQSYGSESRGGACKSDVIISDGEILELAPSVLDVLVAMAQPALDKYLADLKGDGILIYDNDLVKVDDPRVASPRSRGHAAADPEGSEPAVAGAPPTADDNLRVFGLPAKDIAHKILGRDVVANMIMLGCVVSLTRVVSGESLRQAIAESVPPKTVDLNFRAFDEGFRRGLA